MKHGKIYVAGIGPGSEEDITPAVRTAIMQSDVVVGYKYYFNFIRSIVRPETECIDTGMKKEKVRKLTFKERLEMQQLESDMEKLNTEKTELKTALNSGTLDTDELVRSSQRIAEIIDLLDEKEMRWLELSEIE